MLMRILTLLMCLNFAQMLSLADEATLLGLHGNEKSPMAGEKTLVVGCFRMKAEDLDFHVTPEGHYHIKLKGKTQLVCGQTRLSADQMNATFKYRDRGEIELAGNVEIENIPDQLRMFAREARMFWSKHRRTLILNNRDHELVRLIRMSDKKTTLVEASKIHIGYLKPHQLRILAVENSKIEERPGRSTDMVKFEATEQSGFDFFDKISITEFSTHHGKKTSRGSQKISKTEFLQLLK